MSSDDRELWLSYESDATESLRDIEESLLELEGDATKSASINRLYRGLHSLKGNSAFLRLSTIEHLAHVAEDLIGLVRDGGVPLDPQIIELMLESVDALRGMVDSASRDHQDGDPNAVEDLVYRIESAFSERGGQRHGAPLLELELFGDEPKAANSGAPSALTPPAVGPADLGEIEFFLALCNAELTRLSPLFRAAQDCTPEAEQSRQELRAAAARVREAATRLSLVHVVDAASALETAAQGVVGIGAATELEYGLRDAIVAVEEYHATFASEPTSFGFVEAFRRTSADLALADLERLRALLADPEQLTHPELRRLFRRLRYASDYYGLAGGAEVCLDQEDHFARVLEAGELPGLPIRAKGLAFVEALTSRVQAANAGEVVQDMPRPEAANDPMKFTEDARLRDVSAQLKRHLSRTALGALSEVAAKGWVPVEVSASLDAGAGAAEEFQAWLTKTGWLCLTSSVDHAPGEAPSCSFLLGVPSEAALKSELEGFAAGRLFRLRTVPTPAKTPAGAAKAQKKPDDAPRRAPEESEGGSRERAEFLRVDAAKVSLIMDLASEIGLAAGAVMNHPELEGLELEGFAAAAHKLELLVREMQTEVSGMRLVPVAGVFQRMKRVVRDAARRTGKQVELVLEGEETEIDKVMVDSLHDPLVHLLRNAVDHGIESEAERAQAGKRAEGRLVLAASHQAGEVSIVVSDDGRGINQEAVLARAKERGLVAADAALSENQINELIFAPGFSTKAAIDELSGRGVGMDVVKTTIESMRGRVQVRSVTGRGSRVILTMPLTLAFVEAMVVRERDRLFALPIEKVFEVFKPSERHLSRNSADGVTMVRVRDELVPIVWLHRFWGERGDFDERVEGRVVVVVQTSRGELALPVDALLGNQQVMLKPMKGPLAHIRGAAGCGMLRTGDVAVALDCERLDA